jgi:ATP-dependent Clp protease adaptor protein ClpS
MSPFDKRRGNQDSPGRRVKEHTLVLFNDNVNSFNHVIETLSEICHHDELQAEQCAILTHMKGFCEIKRGKYEELLDLQNQLTTQMLLVTLD